MPTEPKPVPPPVPHRTTALDRARLHEALALAEGSFGLTEPNPRVGCVIGHADGSVLGRGATQQAGGPHAEAMALRDAAQQGHSVRGATAWVTLEPCAHHGRTPPCCDALIQAGLGRVVVGLADPFPQVNGQGLARLAAAGIEVVMADAAEQQACRDINIGFLSRVQRGRPWVRLKMAASMDGQAALADGRSQWITGEVARHDVHAWRRRASAVLTGVGTVQADDPRLDVRHLPTPAQPLRIVLDAHWRTPPSARLLAPPGAVLLVGTDPTHTPAAQALQAAGAELLCLPAAPQPTSGVDLHALLPALAARGINELHVEAGPTLSAAWLSSGLVDECLLYLAPKLIGPGRPWLAWPTEADGSPCSATVAEPLGEVALQAAPSWRWIETLAVGKDLRLRALRAEAAGADPGLN